MISLFTTSFADFFDPVAPPPFSPVTPLQLLLSWNSTNTWHAVALCHVQEAGLICSMIMECAWCSGLLAEKDDLWPCVQPGGCSSSGALYSKSLESKTCYLYYLLCYCCSPTA